MNKILQAVETIELRISPFERINLIGLKLLATVILFSPLLFLFTSLPKEVYGSVFLAVGLIIFFGLAIQYHNWTIPTSISISSEKICLRNLILCKIIQIKDIECYYWKRGLRGVGDYTIIQLKNGKKYKVLESTSYTIISSKTPAVFAGVKSIEELLEKKSIQEKEFPNKLRDAIIFYSIAFIGGIVLGIIISKLLMHKLIH